MPITISPLPYDTGALAPYVSAQTLAEHHGAHHASYVKKTNAAIADTDLAKQPLETIIATAFANDNETLHNSSAQTWNHGFYWNSMSATSDAPSDELASAIAASFGSHDAMCDQMVAVGTDHFGSGWVWLIEADGNLAVTATHDAANPINNRTENPLLTIDVWEHAYYLDQQSDRPTYLKGVVANLLNWEFASANFARGTAWVYPV